MGGISRVPRKGKLIIVTGINGVGKTTVLSTIPKLLPPNLHINIYNYGDVMFRIAKESGLANDRDNLRRLPLDVQLVLQEKAAIKLFEQAREGNVIVDTHALITTNNGFLPGLPKWIVEKLLPDIIVLIEASPEDILKHRMTDVSRVRNDQTTLDEIKLFLELNRAAAISSAVLVGASVFLVKNIEGDATQAASKIVKLFTPEKA
jgi:adenylate kinase